jgi:hypothetical protein
VLLQKRINDLWNEDCEKDLPWYKRLKSKPGMAVYLFHDSKVVAARRARLRFNKSSLRASLHSRRLAADPHCPDCKNVTESPQHVIFDCPTYAIARAACTTALADRGLLLTIPHALGGLENVPDYLHELVLQATATLLLAITRIG